MVKTFAEGLIAAEADAVCGAGYEQVSQDRGRRAYLRARDADPKSSYADFAAVSHPGRRRTRRTVDRGRL